MGFFIYLLIFFLLLIVYFKVKERSIIHRFKNKNGDTVPHYTIFRSLLRMVGRMKYGFDIFKVMKEAKKEKGETFSTFFMTTPRLIVKILLFFIYPIVSHHSGIPFNFESNPQDINNVLNMKEFAKPTNPILFSPLFKKYLASSLLMINDKPWL